ncbi:cation diffusion facilitator family transporter [Streptomyces sp. JJ36]|uniref:cation diffusion facilitator family transporter n=1 Tax=Streptomyces sp. JJ36 TaxID=2736645 RepID=UPI001F002110|nr:cation diffusion facilitator family transporter [Streptomyces sp. JJ36]MCF6522642.1 cation diffusion facilitator family transporter [Streptomyces sp. JJ36]
MAGDQHRPPAGEDTRPEESGQPGQAGETAPRHPAPRDDTSAAAPGEGPAEGPGPAPPRGSGTDRDGETRGTVHLALGANLVIAAAKVAGGVVSGSAALLSEAAHSVADSLNELFLLASLRRSRRRPDARHPFGYGKERFFWSLLAAVGIFVMGGCFSFYQAVQAVRVPAPEPAGGYVVALAVLVGAGIAEGVSLAKALRQVRHEARAAGRPFRRQFRHSDDPALRTVLGEDGAAVTGVLLALTGIALHLITGSNLWEAAASLGISALLIYVAYRLGRDARDQLVGEAVPPGLQQEVHAFLERQPEIDAITDLLTMRIGQHSALLAARVDLVPGTDSEDVEEAAVRIKQEITRHWPDVDNVFLDITEAGPAGQRRARRLRHDLVYRAARDDPDAPDAPQDRHDRAPGG